MTSSVGYIGLGAMGGALAGRLAESQDLFVWDLNQQASQRLEQGGAKVSPSAAALARQCKIILVCLPRSQDVHNLIFGEHGMLDGLSPGTIIIDQTSGVPQEARAIAAKLNTHGVHLLDAPVAGGVPAAAAGRITMMVSGPAEAFERALPVLQAISPAVIRCGENVGDGHAIKIINNMVNAVLRISMLESVVMARKLDIPLRPLAQAINQSRACSRLSQIALLSLLEGRASTDFGLPLMVKDVNQAVALSDSAGAPLPLVSLSRSVLELAVNQLGPRSRLEDIIEFIAGMAGTSLTTLPAPPAVAPLEQADDVALGIIGYIGAPSQEARDVLAQLEDTHTVHLFDSDAQSAADPFPQVGDCRLIIIGEAASEEIKVKFFTDEIAARIQSDTIIIDRSIGDPRRTRVRAARLQERGIILIDAPSSERMDNSPNGRKVDALCGGSPDAFVRAKPLLKHFATDVFYMGGSGQGHTAALIVQSLKACNELATLEAIALAEKIGLGMDYLNAVINKGSGWAHAFEKNLAIRRGVENDEPLPLAHITDNLSLCCDLAFAAQAPMLITNSVRNTLRATSNELGGTATICDVMTVFSRRAGA